MFSNILHPMGPGFAEGMLLITINAAHPSRTLRTGFLTTNRPDGTTVWSDSSPKANGPALASH